MIYGYDVISIRLKPVTTTIAKRFTQSGPHPQSAYFYQNIWTTPGDLSKGEINIYNENFFRDLSAYYMEWEC